MSKNNNSVKVIGAGLAGCEAAWVLANAGHEVDLYEMKPQKRTAAHSSDFFAELVCSNSLRADSITNGVGLLKAEMRLLGSIIMEAADKTRVPAGGALAVDRELFSNYVTGAIRAHPLINVLSQEVIDIEQKPTIIATGPLTSELLSESIRQLIGNKELYFYDAAAPIITRESIDFDKVYVASRYDKGEAAYINCPMDEQQFDAFYDFLINAELAPRRDFEDVKVFEGCMPVEVMAKRGRQTLLFGPMKPVGLPDPRTGKEAFAVVQLRQENLQATMYNLVGFQTHLKWGEQKKLMQFIPGLEAAEIIRYGVMHRNTFINSPGVLNNHYQLISNNDIFFAGQITGVEGYVESAASGIVAGINMFYHINQLQPKSLTTETMIGAMIDYVANYEGKNFQPINANFGLLPSLGYKIRNKQERYQKYADRSLAKLSDHIKILVEENEKWNNHFMQQQ